MNSAYVKPKILAKIISSNELLKREYVDLRVKRQLENEQVVTNFDTE